MNLIPRCRHTDGLLQFPELIDNSIRASFVSCPRKAYWSFIRQEVPAPPSIHLHAGAAFARGLEVARRSFYQCGWSVDTSLAAGLRAAIEYWGDYDSTQYDEANQVKDILRVCTALDFYLTEKWPIEHDYLRPLMEDGKASVEFTFALPLPLAHPETGQPLLYGGRADMLALYNDALFITDEKTGKQLGPTWANKWRLEAQFTGYVWAARQFGFPVAGAIIRGISFLKYGHEGQEAIIYRPEWMVEAWFEQLLQDIERMIACWKSGYWHQNLSDSCSAYGGCGYLKLCESPSPDQWLRPYFVRREWKPLERDEKVVEASNG